MQPDLKVIKVTKVLRGQLVLLVNKVQLDHKEIGDK